MQTFHSIFPVAKNRCKVGNTSEPLLEKYEILILLHHFSRSQTALFSFHDLKLLQAHVMTTRGQPGSLIPLHQRVSSFQTIPVSNTHRAFKLCNSPFLFLSRPICHVLGLGFWTELKWLFSLKVTTCFLFKQSRKLAQCLSVEWIKHFLSFFPPLFLSFSRPAVERWFVSSRGSYLPAIVSSTSSFLCAWLWFVIPV